MPANANEVAAVVLWGATGQARVLRDCLAGGPPLVALFDRDAAVASPFPDVPIHHGDAGFAAWLATCEDPGDVGFLVAIGGARGDVRLQIQARLAAAGLTPLTTVHRTAFVAPNATLGAGTQICANATVCVDARIGDGCIINTAASVDHECVLADGVHIAPGAHLAGLVEVGRGATVFTGASVAPRVRIGAGAIVGAGAVVLSDVADGAVVVGNPARVIKRG